MLIDNEAVHGLIQVQDNKHQMGQVFENMQQEHQLENYQEVEPIAIDEEANVPGTIGTENIIQSHEDMVRHYVQSTLMAAVAYRQETELSKRVREWEENIRPWLLKEASAHPQ